MSGQLVKAVVRIAKAVPTLYALDCSGKRIGKVDFTRNGTLIAFNAVTDRGRTACFAYELTN